MVFSKLVSLLHPNTLWSSSHWWISFWQICLWSLLDHFSIFSYKYNKSLLHAEQMEACSILAAVLCLVDSGSAESEHANSVGYLVCNSSVLHMLGTCGYRISAHIWPFSIDSCWGSSRPGTTSIGHRVRIRISCATRLATDAMAASRCMGDPSFLVLGFLVCDPLCSFVPRPAPAEDRSGALYWRGLSQNLLFLRRSSLCFILKT